MHYLCSQRKDYSNSLTLYVPPDITSRTFHTYHGWTWGLCSLDFIQCLLHDPCFRHSGVRLESLGALRSCSDICRPQKLKAGSTGCLTVLLVRPPAVIHRASLVGVSCLVWFGTELSSEKRVCASWPPTISESQLPWCFPCRVSFRLCECHTIKLKCALREESEIFSGKMLFSFF